MKIQVVNNTDKAINIDKLHSIVLQPGETRFVTSWCYHELVKSCSKVTRVGETPSVDSSFVLEDLEDE